MRSSARLWALASAGFAFTTLAAYIVLIVSEGNNSFWDVLPWSMLMVIAGSAPLVAAAVTERPVGRAFAWASAVVLLPLGWVSMFSVGTGFVVAAMCALIAAATA